MIILLGVSKQEDFHWPEKPLEKAQEINNESSQNEKEIQQKSEANNSVRHPGKISNIFGVTRYADDCRFVHVYENNLLRKEVSFWFNDFLIRPLHLSPNYTIKNS